MEGECTDCPIGTYKYWVGDNACNECPGNGKSTVAAGTRYPDRCSKLLQLLPFTYRMKGSGT